MTDMRELRRRQEADRLQGALDQIGARTESADSATVQREIDSLLEIGEPRSVSDGKPRAGAEHVELPGNREERDAAALSSREAEAGRPGLGSESDRVPEHGEEINDRLDRAADNRRVHHEIDRICTSDESHRPELDRTTDRLERLERISERDAMRQLPGFDPERVREMEDLEIHESPEAFIRRHEGGLDPETERELKESFQRNRC